MAAITIDTQEHKISYDIVKNEDAEEVLQLLKDTFFKVDTFFMYVI